MKRFPTHTAEQTLWTGEALPFNLSGEKIDNSVTDEGEARVRALAEREARKAQMYVWDSAPFTLTDPPGKHTLYKTARTLVGGRAFTSNQCVAVRYIGLGVYRINETAETLHECHLTDFCF